ncbi:hypothetical protein [Pseudoalteromonas ruthenica]|uniref:hypothetical protein n=1 Tax=Pseudoalteromonas ruthenica TaxID=151081 RepID=UPI00110C0B2D|nr:hypothetical protein [Pseudoalteromonas ruthenica]TMO46173.1 hypothetical protein CWC24_10715 [Pseudoalteromonas ruthenica]TMO51596.1 hypothetical protein CWC23_06630 [Pseudoalteromonas ruthenica]
MFLRALLISITCHMLILGYVLSTATPAIMRAHQEEPPATMQVVMISLPPPENKIEQPVHAPETIKPQRSVNNDSHSATPVQKEEGEGTANQHSEALKSRAAAAEKADKTPVRINPYAHFEQRVTRAFAKTQSSAGVGKVQLDELPRYSGPDITSMQQSTGVMQVLAGDKVTGNYLLRQDGRCFVMDASSPMAQADMPAGEVICPHLKQRKQAAFDAAMSKWLQD